MYANFVIQHAAFDFHKTATAFIEYHVDPLYSKEALTTNRQLRSYMKERSFGAKHSVNYDLVVEVKEGKVQRLCESATIVVEGEDVIDIAIDKELQHDGIQDAYEQVESAVVIESLQTAFTRHNELVPNGDHKSALSSLLPLLRVISTKAVKCYATKRAISDSWVFVLADDEEYVNVIHVLLHEPVASAPDKEA